MPTVTDVPPPTATATETATAHPALEVWEPGKVPDDEQLRQFVSGMSLADKIGQMMLVGFSGQSLKDAPQLETLISTYHVGGLILQGRSARNPRQLSQLLADAQDLAAETGSGIPLFVSINHEGGSIVHIAEGVTHFPGNMALGATGRTDYAYLAAAMAADELRAMGINMNLAPVLDVNKDPLNPIIGARSFGGSPDLVKAMGRETIKGLQQQGVIAVGKHYPGHGSVRVDSHAGLPVLEKEASELEEIELPPFEMAVGANVEAIMTAHIAVPAWEPEPNLPATLSANIVTGILRHRMGYDGIIMTDSLGMGAISRRWTQAEAAVEAVKAGADMVLSTGPFEVQEGIHDALVTAVQNGAIPLRRIDASVLRILRVKHKYRLFEKQQRVDRSTLNSAEHQAMADEIGLASITVYKDDDELVPLPKDVRRLLVISPRRLPSASEGDGTLLAEELRGHGYDVTELVFDVSQTGSRDTIYTRALELAPEHDLVIFGEWQLIGRYTR
ncbi:MAG: glycoside hydrolase family 3 protein, partial [Anaerolineae bacterium]